MAHMRMTNEELIRRLDFMAKVKYDADRLAGRKGAAWAIGTYIEYVAARRIENALGRSE